MVIQVNLSNDETIKMLVARIENTLCLVPFSDDEVITRLYIIAMKVAESKALLKESLGKMGN